MLEYVMYVIPAALQNGTAALELAPADAKLVTHLLQSVVTGSLMRWAIFRRGSARTWLARDLDAAIETLR